MATASTEAPSWTEENEWAYEGKAFLDIAQGTEQYETLKNIIDLFSDSELNALYMNGTVDVYVYMSVKNVTATECKVQVIIGAKAEVIANVNIDANIPTNVEGSPTGTTVAKIVSANGNADLVYYSTMNMIVDRSSMAVRSLDMNSKVMMNIDLSATNVPIDDVDGTTQFRSFHVGVDMMAYLNTSATFTPSLDLFKFPIGVGEKWYVSSIMNISGNLSGSLTVDDPSNILDDLDTTGEIGDMDGPIDLSNYTGEFSGYEMDQGQIGPYDEDIYASLNCTEIRNIPTGTGSKDVYVINVNENSHGEPEFIIMYSPEVASFASIEVTSSILDELDTGAVPGIDVLSMVDLNFEDNLKMEIVEPSVAAQGIEQITGEHVSTKTNTGTSSPSSDNVMFLALIGVAAIVVVIVAMVLMKHKK